MYCKLNGVNRLNLFALVTYIPEPLGTYLNEIRRELVRDCNVYSHVTVLPPRSLCGPVDRAWERIAHEASATPAFDIQPSGVDIFSKSSVIYLAIGEGSRELRAMHDRLNRAELEFQEEYTYHPHITLAQKLPEGSVDAALKSARKLWAEYPFPSRFALDHVTFVQNTEQNQWLDLYECPLAQVAPVAT